MNILITGAGSVMGQSIYKALAMHDFGEPLQVHFANSEEIGAGRFFSLPSAPVVQAPLRKREDDDLRGGVQDASGTTWWIASQ